MKSIRFSEGKTDSPKATSLIFPKRIHVRECAPSRGSVPSLRPSPARNAPGAPVPALKLSGSMHPNQLHSGMSEAPEVVEVVAEQNDEALRDNASHCSSTSTKEQRRRMGDAALKRPSGLLLPDKRRSRVESWLNNYNGDRKTFWEESGSWVDLIPATKVLKTLKEVRTYNCCGIMRILHASRGDSLCAAHATREKDGEKMI